MTDRYKIVAESISGHCCFEWTIVDTQRPLALPNGDPWLVNGQPRHHQICECFEEADAKLIAHALNTQPAPACRVCGGAKGHVIGCPNDPL